MLNGRQIAFRLGASFFVLLAITIVVGILGLAKLRKENERRETLLGRDWNTMKLAQEALQLSNNNNRVVMQLFLAHDKASIDALESVRAEHSRQISSLLDRIEPLCDNADEQKLLENIRETRAPYIQSYERALNLLLKENNRTEAVRIIEEEATPALLRYHSAYVELIHSELDEIDEAARETRLQQAQRNHLFLGAIVLASLLTGIIGLIVTRGIAADAVKRVDEVLRTNRELAHEIAEKEAAEKALREAIEAAEMASRAKSTFLANMSHEIRTPMNGVLGMTELALETELTPEQRDYVLTARSSAEALTRIINDILDFSKVEAGKLDIELIDFNLHDTLADLMRSMAMSAHEKGLELVCDVSPDVPENLAGDPGRLRQILVNLIGNAVKFTSQGEISVQVRRLDPENAKQAELQFEVSDTGIGIAPEQQGSIFEAFAQADNSITRKYGGTGLGLSICSRLVAMMGGQINVRSDPGKGSTFSFNVRLGIVQGTPAIRHKHTNFEKLNIPVLIVDDNSTNRRILCEMTSGWGMRPTAVESGAAALESLSTALDQAPYPLVLLDLQMPEMSGFELSDRIRQNRRFDGTALILLTSAGQRGDAARCKELGIAAYLLKPVHKSDLLAAILTILGNENDRESTALVTRHSVRESFRHLNILVAEDNNVNQKLIVRVLEKMGHSVVVAHDGREALELRAAHDLDVIFMDVQMPVMDGLAATRAIREKERASGGHIPIVAMTAHALKEDRERCLQAGMDDYIAKPLNKAEIARVLEELPGATAGFNLRHASPGVATRHS